jgi:hypothetical protein
LKSIVLTTDSPQTVDLTVPSEVNFIVAAIGYGALIPGGTGGFYEARANIQPKSGASFLDGSVSTNPPNLICIVNKDFPPIPVSEGERLMVAFEDVGTVIVYFDQLS